MSESSNGAVSRRELLRRGAIAGGALMWATPTVQTLGMGRALAAQPSGDCRLHCVRYDVGAGRWSAVGQGGGGACFSCPDGAVSGAPAALRGASVSGSALSGLTIGLPSGMTVWDSSETGTPDEFTGQSGVWVVCGNKDEGRACHFQAVEAGASSFTVSPCGGGKRISHIELLVRSCA